VSGLRRAGSAGIFAAVAGFAALFVVAAHRYPGGTWFDPTTVGHRFWANFLCDLAWERALDGRPNPGAAAMRAGLLVATAGLLIVWWVVPVLFTTRRRIGWAVRGLGSVSVISTFVSALVPSEHAPAVHEISVVAAAAPGIAALALTTWALSREEPRPRVGALLGGLVLALATVDLCLYVAEVMNLAPLTIAGPAIQKLAVIGTLAWECVLAARVWAGPGSRSGDRSHRP
jgi:hypothetical protein